MADEERNFPTDLYNERFKFQTKSFGFYKEIENIREQMMPFYSEDNRMDDYAVTDNCYEWYYSISKQFKPNRIAEIGVRNGYSAAAMLLGYPEAEYIGYDIEEESYRVNLEWTRQNLSSFKKVTIIKVDTQECALLPLLENEKADLIHVDGDHSTHGCLHDCDLALKSLNDGGIIVIDDIDFYKDFFHITKLWANTHDLVWEYYPTFRGTMIISGD